METLRIQEKSYPIEDIRPEMPHVLRIRFSEEIPESFSEFTLYTEGGLLAARYQGYVTIYKREQKTIWLSDDGSKEGPSEAILPELSFEEEKRKKREELSIDAQKKIYQGISVTLSNGEKKHFSLTEYDQINLFGKLSELNSGEQKCAYHADNEACTFFSAEDMQLVIKQAMWFVSYHTTRLNALLQWTMHCRDKEELHKVFYGADIPEAYQNEVLKSYLKKIREGAATE